MEIRPTYPIFLEAVTVKRHIFFFGLRTGRRPKWLFQTIFWSVQSSSTTKNRMKFNFLSKIQNVRSEIDLVVDVGVTSWFIFNTLLIVIVEIFQCSDRHRKENPERYMYVVILILIGLVISVFGNREVNHGSTKMKVKRREWKDWYYILILQKVQNVRCQKVQKRQVCLYNENVCIHDSAFLYLLFILMHVQLFSQNLERKKHWLKSSVIKTQNPPEGHHFVSRISNFSYRQRHKYYIQLQCITNLWSNIMECYLFLCFLSSCLINTL